MGTDVTLSLAPSWLTISVNTNQFLCLSLSTEWRLATLPFRVQTWAKLFENLTKNSPS